MAYTALDINSWRKNLGFFPHTLFQKKHQQEKYVLLNGKAGNFCIDYTDEEPDNCRSYAWSANVGHYITIRDEKLKVFRWDRLAPTDELSVSRVADRIGAFNDYLSSQKFDFQSDSINLSLRLYREIRGSLRDESGDKSLSALLCAFAAFEDDVPLNKLNIEKWGISNNALSIAEKVNRHVWNNVSDQLSDGIKSLEIKPQVEILLRHASGKIFQEAHLDAIFSPQLQFDFASPTIIRSTKGGSTSSHYTPTSIVRSVVEEVLREFDLSNKSEITIFDPAVGSGEFLKEILRQLNLKSYTGKIKLVGWDISTTAIDLARFSLAFEKQAAKLPARINIVLEQKNALTKGDSWNFNSDIILMNPPFIGHENMDDNEKERVSSILGNLYQQRPNEAGAFIWKAANSLKADGRIGCVIPNTILEANSFRKLRLALSDKLHIDFLGKLGNQLIFEDATTATSILICSSPANTKPTQVMWSDNSNDGYASGLREFRKATSIMASTQPFLLPGSNFNFYPIEKLNNENWTPVDVKSYQLINVKLRKMTKVKDLFEIKQGVRTGLNKAFIVPKSFYRSLPRGEQKYFRPTITNDSIISGQLNDSFYIFYAEGKYSIKNERELKNVVPTFYREIFSKYFTKLTARARKSIDNYWRLSEHRNWQLEPQPKLVSKEYGLAGAFAFDNKGIYVAARSHAWFPLDSKNWSDLGYAYVSVLSMNIINDLLGGISKPILSGSYFLASQYIYEMPLPNLFDNSIDNNIKNELIQIGKQISEGGCTGKIKMRLSELTDKVFNG